MDGIANLSCPANSLQHLNFELPPLDADGTYHMSSSFMSDLIQLSSPVRKAEPSEPGLSSAAWQLAPLPTLSEGLTTTPRQDYSSLIDPFLDVSASRALPSMPSPYKSPGGKVVSQPLLTDTNLERVQRFVKDNAPTGASVTDDVVAHHAMFANIMAERGHTGPFVLAGRVAIEIDPSKSPSKNCRAIATFDNGHRVWIDLKREVLEDFDETKYVNMFDVLDKDNEMQAFVASQPSSGLDEQDSEFGVLQSIESDSVE